MSHSDQFNTFLFPGTDISLLYQSIKSISLSHSRIKFTDAAVLKHMMDKYIVSEVHVVLKKN